MKKFILNKDKNLKSLTHLEEEIENSREEIYWMLHLLR